MNKASRGYNSVIGLHIFAVVSLAPEWPFSSKTTKNESTLTLSQEEASCQKPKGKDSVELFKEGGEGAGQEEIIDRHDNLTEARAIYRGRVAQYSGRPVMLRDCLR
jgi:hypothetical protein